MNILITGGYGLIGSWLTRYFLNDNSNIYILTNKKNAFFSGRVNEIFIDITNYKELEKKLNFEFDYCLHLASFDNYESLEGIKKSIDVNVLGTRNLLETLQGRNIKKFVYFSTYHVYSQLSGEISENYPTYPKSDYGLSHLFAEKYIKMFEHKLNFPTVIFRTSNTYGCPLYTTEKTWNTILNDFCLGAFQKNEITLNSNGFIYKDFIWLQDICEVTKALLDQNSGENRTYNLCSGKTIQLIQLAHIVKDVAEKLFKVDINIQTNASDQNQYQNYTLNNNLLTSISHYSFKDKLKSEIVNIFQYLQKNARN